MKTIALALAAILIAPSFCLQLQQTRATTFQGRNTASQDIVDSETFFQTAMRAPNRSRDNEGRITGLLKQMTLEEKVGQMTQLEIGMVTTGQDQNIRIDPAKLEKAIVRYGVGSILAAFRRRR